MSFIHRRNLKTKLKKGALILMSIYVLVGVGLYFLQESFIFQPTTLPKDHVFELSYQFEEYMHNPKEGVVINALHIKSQNPKGVIFYCHGNAGDLQRWGKLVEYLVDLNYDVYIFDYRGFGKSEGTMSEAAFYEDAEFCYQHLKQLWDEDQIIIYGRSLGSAAAVKVASQNKPRALILEAPFSSITDVGKSRFPIYPVSSLLKYEFPNNKYIKDIDYPISIIHGTNDFTIPLSSAQKLFESSNSSNTSFTIIDNGGHNNLQDFDLYHKRIGEILR